MKLKKSQAVGIKELIATLVVAGILIVIGVAVFSKVNNTTSNMLTGDGYSEATSTITNIEGTTYDSLELTTVALIILAAAVIIGILIRAFEA